MKRITKAEAKAQRAEWAKALAEGRVVRFPEFSRLTSYPTVAAAETACAEAVAQGMSAVVVKV